MVVFFLIVFWEKVWKPYHCDPSFFHTLSQHFLYVYVRNINLNKKVMIKINTEDLLDWRNKKELTYASCHKSSLELTCTLMGGYKLYHNKKLILETDQVMICVKKYNSLLVY